MNSCLNHKKISESNSNWKYLLFKLFVIAFYFMKLMFHTNNTHEQECDWNGFFVMEFLVLSLNTIFILEINSICENGLPWYLFVITWPRSHCLSLSSIEVSATHTNQTLVWSVYLSYDNFARRLLKSLFQHKEYSWTRSLFKKFVFDVIRNHIINCKTLIKWQEYTWMKFSFEVFTFCMTFRNITECTGFLNFSNIDEKNSFSKYGYFMSSLIMWTSANLCLSVIIIKIQYSG